MYRGKEERFTKLVQTYAKDLYVKWLRDVERWGICSKGRTGKEYIIFKAETPGGGYRDVDERDIRTLREADLQQRSKGFSLSKEILTFNDEHEKQQYQNLTDSVTAISKERWRHTMGHPQVVSGTEFK